MKKCIFLFLLLFSVCGCRVADEKKGADVLETRRLHIKPLGKKWQADSGRVLAAQPGASKGGSTSVRNVDERNLEWKSQGYYQRNRDLGQVFLARADWQLEAIVLRTGPSDKAVLEGAPGSRVFIQFFDVSGSPRINDNGTPPGTTSRHGFSEVHRCDDFLEGVIYEPNGFVFEGVFPDIPVSFRNGEAVNADDGRMFYMRWQFDEPLKLHEGKQYAFMIGFTEPGPDRGFTLANANAAGVDAPPALNDEYDAYGGGWGLRREGDGSIPPVMDAGTQEPAQGSDDYAIHTAQSLFPAGTRRYSLQPVTDGYPDVDTYRDLEFVLEGTVD